MSQAHGGGAQQQQQQQQQQQHSQQHSQQQQRASANASRYTQLGESCFAKGDRINSDLFTLTYGALVAQLVKDLEDVDQVNEKLEQMGFNIGQRLIDEFLAKSGVPRCASFRETADIVAKVGFKMFLNTAPEVGQWNEQASECTLRFNENPLEDFVQLPQSCAGLKYCNLLCGVLRGALESVHLSVACEVVADALKGDPKTEIKLSLKGVMEDVAGENYREE